MGLFSVETVNHLYSLPFFCTVLSSRSSSYLCVSLSFRPCHWAGGGEGLQPRPASHHLGYVDKKKFTRLIITFFVLFCQYRRDGNTMARRNSGLKPLVMDNSLALRFVRILSYLCSTGVASKPAGHPDRREHTLSQRVSSTSKSLRDYVCVYIYIYIYMCI